MLLIAAACRSSDVAIPVPTTTATTTPTTDAGPTTTATAATVAPTTPDPPTTTVAPTTTLAPITVEPAAVEQFWIDVWQQAAQPAATADDLADVTTPEVADRLIFTLQDEGSRTVVNAPFAGDISDDGTVTVDDCLLLTPSFTESASNWYTGTVESTEPGRFRLTTLDVVSITGCVPARRRRCRNRRLRGLLGRPGTVLQPTRPDQPPHRRTHHRRHAMEFIGVRLAPQPDSSMRAGSYVTNQPLHPEPAVQEYLSDPTNSSSSTAS